MTQSMYLRTEELPLESLTPFPGNAKRGAVDRIRESLKEHGQYRALVVWHTPDGAFVVLAGNHTLLALKAEGVPQARCELIACDDSTARKINIADNRLPKPGAFVAGLSKLPRVLDVYARRLQTQEQLTKQVTDALDKHLDTFGSACIIRSEHGCLAHRGARKPGAVMTTASYTGVFDTDLRARTDLHVLLASGSSGSSW